MNLKFRRYLIGTIERPTMFIMPTGELSDNPEDAEIFDSVDNAEMEIQKCDEPELYKVYNVEVRVLDI